MTIQTFVTERQIKYLLHFTRLANLDSILAHGLYTRSQCAEHRIVSVTNDAYRLDHEDAICLSVSFPNYKMFYPLRMDNPGTEWVVVAIKVSILWEKDCAFCRENAAKSSVTNIPIAQRKGTAAFHAMFGDFEDKPRTTLNLPLEMPTHPQAEVLVFDHIEPEYIIGVAFSDKVLESKYSAKNMQYGFKYIPHWFNGRQDNAHWKR